MSGPVPRYGDQHAPLAIAHRGGAALAPENTLAAFGRSVALGVRYLETDVRLTADGELMCFHDEGLQCVTTGSGPFAQRTRAELDAVLVRGADGTLAPIPSLAEALEAFPEACFTVDLKDRAAIAPMARLLRREDYGRRVCVAGAWDGWLELLRSQAPHVQTALGWRSLTTLISTSRAGAPVPARLVQGRFAHVPLHLGRVPVHSAALVRRAARLGVRVVVWTVDEPAQMHHLLDMGVDGLISDRPDVLREVMLERGSWPGEGRIGWPDEVGARG